MRDGRADRQTDSKEADTQAERELERQTGTQINRRQSREGGGGGAVKRNRCR